MLYTATMQKYTVEKQPRTTQIIFGEMLPLAKQIAKQDDISVSKYVRDLVKRDYQRRLRRERQTREQVMA